MVAGGRPGQQLAAERMDGLAPAARAPVALLPQPSLPGRPLLHGAAEGVVVEDVALQQLVEPEAGRRAVAGESLGAHELEQVAVLRAREGRDPVPGAAGLARREAGGVGEHEGAPGPQAEHQALGRGLPPPRVAALQQRELARQRAPVALDRGDGLPVGRAEAGQQVIPQVRLRPQVGEGRHQRVGLGLAPLLLRGDDLVCADPPGHLAGIAHAGEAVRPVDRLEVRRQAGQPPPQVLAAGGVLEPEGEPMPGGVGGEDVAVKVRREVPVRIPLGACVQPERGEEGGEAGVERRERAGDGVVQDVPAIEHGGEQHQLVGPGPADDGAAELLDRADQVGWHRRPRRPVRVAPGTGRAQHLRAAGAVQRAPRVSRWGRARRGHRGSLPCR